MLMFLNADVLERLLFYGKPFAGALGEKNHPAEITIAVRRGGPADGRRNTKSRKSGKQEKLRN